MKLLDGWRRQVRSVVPRGFIRRDQQTGALLASDFPRFDEAEKTARRLKEAGYTVHTMDGVAHITPGEDLFFRWLRELPCPPVCPTDDTLFSYAMAQRLLREKAPMNRRHLSLLVELCKALDAGNFTYLNDFSQQLALCQRRHQPLPAAAGKLILCALYTLEGGTFPC